MTFILKIRPAHFPVSRACESDLHTDGQACCHHHRTRSLRPYAPAVRRNAKDNENQNRAGSGTEAGLTYCLALSWSIAGRFWTFFITGCPKPNPWSHPSPRWAIIVHYMLDVRLEISNISAERSMDPSQSAEKYVCWQIRPKALGPARSFAAWLINHPDPVPANRLQLAGVQTGCSG